MIIKMTIIHNYIKMNILFISLLLIFKTSRSINSNFRTELSIVPNSEILHYQFLMANYIPNLLIDTNQNNYIGGLKSLSRQENLVRLPSNGISLAVNSLISKRNISFLINNAMKTSSSISMEFWLQPNLTNYADSTILSIGANGGSNSGTSCDYNLQLIQLADKQNMSGFTVNMCNQNGANTGTRLSSKTSFKIADNRYKIIHLVVVLTFVTTKIFDSNVQLISANYTINGINLNSNFRTYLTSESGYNPSNWNPSYYLSFNPFLGSSRAWGGNIYEFSLYNRELSYQEILNNYRISIPNSLPVTFNATIIVQENGEIGDHSKDPQFYEKPIANNEVSIINIPVFDADDKEYNPNYNLVLGPTMKVYLFASLLSNSSGIIYSLDGSNPTKTSISIDGIHSTVVYKIPYNEKLRSYSFRYRPPYNVYSIPITQVITTFYFIAQDGVTGIFSSTKGKISVSVVHVDKPPIVKSYSHVYVLSKTYSIITLSGVRTDGALLKAAITKAPKYGSFHQIYPNGTINKQVIVQNNSEYFIYGSPNMQFQIGYYFSGVAKSPTVSTYAVDFFSYRFYDITGRFSMIATYNISINSSLKAIAINFNIMLLEKTSMNVTIYGMDSSNAHRSLRIRILSIPRYGNLFHRNGKKIMVSDILDDVIPSGYYADGLVTKYRGNDYYFSYPKKNWNGTLIKNRDDSFNFNVFSDDGEVSNVVNREIIVQNVNDPTNLTFVPPKGWSNIIYAIGATSSSTASQYSTSLTLSGFSLIDRDLGVDVIKARIYSSGSGRITLNKNYRNQLDFNSDKYCFGATSWQCIGDGNSNSNMIFVAAPSVIESAINGMTYESLTQNIIDNITIVLYDGAGYECLTNGQLGDGSIRNDCFIFTYSITVRVLGYSGFQDNTLSQSSSSGYTRLQYVAIALIICISLIVLRCLYLRYYKKKNTESIPDESKNNSCCFLLRWRKRLADEINYANVQYIVRQMKKSKTEKYEYPKKPTEDTIRIEANNNINMRDTDGFNMHNNNNYNNYNNNINENDYDPYHGNPFVPPSETEMYYPVNNINNISYINKNQSSQRFKTINRSDSETTTQQYFNNNMSRKNYLSNKMNFEHFRTEPYNQSYNNYHNNKYKNRYNTSVSNKSLKSSRRKKRRDSFNNNEEYI